MITARTPDWSSFFFSSSCDSYTGIDWNCIVKKWRLMIGGRVINPIFLFIYLFSTDNAIGKRLQIVL